MKENLSYKNNNFSKTVFFHKKKIPSTLKKEPYSNALTPNLFD